MSQQHFQSGKVILAGAGPGDPELVTMKLARYLSQADVIVTDRLVNQEIIRQYARKDVIVIHAGKKGFSSESVKQEEINKILVQCARRYAITVRLKGGDTAFFSNILDELFILSGFSIPFEIVPGITAASGASAYAGIPLTARDYASGVRFITAHEITHISEREWTDLSMTTDTLVCYMGLNHVQDLLQKLYERNPYNDKPVALIDRATTVEQQVWISSLSRFPTEFMEINAKGPSLVLVGEVVHLHHRFNWFRLPVETSLQTTAYAH